MRVYLPVFVMVSSLVACGPTQPRDPELPMATPTPANLPSIAVPLPVAPATPTVRQSSAASPAASPAASASPGATPDPTEETDEDEIPDDVVELPAPGEFQGGGRATLTLRLQEADPTRAGTNDVRALEVMVEEARVLADKEVTRTRVEVGKLKDRQFTVAVDQLKAGTYDIHVTALGLSDATLGTGTRRITLEDNATVAVAGTVNEPPTGKVTFAFSDAPALYVQNGTPTSMVVKWESAVARAAKLELHDDAGKLLRTLDGPNQRNHRFAIDGLSEGTRYRYVALEGTEVGRGEFKTNNGQTQQKFKFIHMGDCGTGSREQYAVAHRMALWKPDFVVLAGDIVYPSGAAKHYGPRFVAPYRTLIDHLVFFPSLGNHDTYTDNGQPYLDFFDVPGRYYTFKYGHAQFFALDSNVDPGYSQPQTRWLTEQLQASSATWKFAFFHHPPYSSGWHASALEVRENWGPLFEKYDVNLVLTGHDHHYERTKPREDYVKDGTPTTYLVSGGGGAATRNPGKDDFSAMTKGVFHFVGITVDGGKLSAEAIDQAGTVIDTFKIDR